MWKTEGEFNKHKVEVHNIYREEFLQLKTRNKLMSNMKHLLMHVDFQALWGEKSHRAGAL